MYTEPAVDSRWVWVARPERPPIRVHSVFTSWAGNRVIRVGYETPPNPHSQCEFWTYTVPEFYCIFKEPPHGPASVSPPAY